jgi:DNA-binding transcriptional ArsR family regulator
MPNLHWDIATAYDLFVSLYVLLHPDQFGVRPSWAAGVRQRLPAKQREFLEHTSSFLPVPLRWIYLLPAGRHDAADALIALAQIPNDERLYSLLPTPNSAPELIEVFKGITLRQSWSPAELEVIRTILQRKGKSLFKPPEIPLLCDALAHAAEFGESYLEALSAYQDVFFAEEEQRLRPALETGLAEAQALALTMHLDALLTTLSRGVHFSDLNRLDTVILAPSYWANPLVFYRRFDPGSLLVLFGSRPAGLGVSAGECAPDHLVSVLKAVADSSRLVILRALAEEPQTPSQLARRLHLRPPTVIHHLNALRLAGLVEITLQHEAERAYTLRKTALAAAVADLSHYLSGSSSGGSTP